MPRYHRHELEDALAESLATHPDLPAMVPMVPDLLPLTMRRAQQQRRRWARLRAVSGDALVLIALSLLYAALCCVAAWSLWP